MNNINIDSQLGNRFNSEYIFEMYESNRQAFKKDDAIETCFKGLNNSLEGGLHKGLITIGAASGIGKSTFCLQIADNIAAASTHVLFFALEMGIEDLINKSLSRIAYETNKAELSCMDMRKFYNEDIEHSKEQIEANNNAIKKYNKICKYMHIIQCNSRTTAKNIIQSITDFIKEFKQKPVVIVDYLQIIAPKDDLRNYTERQVVEYNLSILKDCVIKENLAMIMISSVTKYNACQEITADVLKESGLIEFSSEVIIGLQFFGTNDSNFDLNKAKIAHERQIECVILKNKYGQGGGKSNYTYIAKVNHFKCLSEDDLSKDDKKIYYTNAGEGKFIKNTEKVIELRKQNTAIKTGLEDLK